MRRIITGLVLAAGVLFGLATPASAGPVEGKWVLDVQATAAANAGCNLYGNPARPTTTGAHRDPCANNIYTYVSGSGEQLYRLATGVDFWWSMAGGAHITDARGAGRVTDISPSDAFSGVQVDSGNLGYTGTWSGVLISCWQCPVNLQDGNDSLAFTPWDGGEGCGTVAARFGGSSVHTHFHFSMRSRFTGNVIYDDLYSGRSIYQFDSDGVC